MHRGDVPELTTQTGYMRDDVLQLFSLVCFRHLRLFMVYKMTVAKRGLCMQLFHYDVNVLDVK